MSRVKRRLRISWTFLNDKWGKLVKHVKQHPITLMLQLVLTTLVGLVLWWALNPTKAAPAWSGFNTISPPLSYKTLWDWLGLLIVPVLLVWGGWLLARRDKDKEEKRSELERSIALDKRHQETLDMYLWRVSSLLLETSQSSQDAHQLANRGFQLSSAISAQTVAVLRVLDGKRKSQVVQYLYSYGFIKDSLFGTSLVKVDLAKADLRGVDFIVGRPSDVDSKYTSDDWGAEPLPLLIEYVNKFHDNESFKIDLSYAILNKADLYQAAFVLTKLNNAWFIDAQLKRAYFLGARLVTAKFNHANLVDSNFYKADCITADFRDADLSGASFEKAKLYVTDFRGANLQDTVFSGAEYTVGKTKFPEGFDPVAAGAIPTLWAEGEEPD